MEADKQQKLVLALTGEFKKVHPDDSQYTYPVRQGAIDLTLVYDVRLHTSTNPRKRNVTIDVSILNVKSPARTLRLINKIDRHFKDLVIMTDEFMVKFDRYQPIASQQHIETDEKLFRMDLTMEAIYYDDDPHQPESIQLSKY